MLNRLQSVFASLHRHDVHYLVIGGIAAWRQWRAPSAARVQAALQAAGAMPWRAFADQLERAWRAEGHEVQRTNGAHSAVTTNICCQRASRRPCAPACCNDVTVWPILISSVNVYLCIQLERNYQSAGGTSGPVWRCAGCKKTCAPARTG